jgi:hypothetical protein
LSKSLIFLAVTVWPQEQVLDALEAAFIADNVRFIRIDGKTPPARRHQLVESFQVCRMTACFDSDDICSMISQPSGSVHIWKPVLS